ncbi:MAG TPA: hypothetical protein IAD32_05005 [Candidatus Scatavimonas merdigallinarum]|uniref:Uncharacterized protein n=1 Tax=Candidatus Scatavimonas merdigallinarum TaxID=2840914 RepID=A0A9D0ZHA1_9FIRM|nr:hypothetical protein [Candidatus Scatavimonas merdigallinarum]
MDRNCLKKMEIIGVFFTFIGGTLLHFAYEWSGGAVWSILFGAVNESVWEHVKIFAMPYLLWGVLELCCARPYFKMFVIAKVAGVYFLSAIIIAFFYLYSGIAGTSVLWVDIVSVFVWIALAHLLSYKITLSDRDLRAWFVPALFALLLFAAMYFGFSAAPPQIDLFKDPQTGAYGLQAAGGSPQVYAGGGMIDV